MIRDIKGLLSFIKEDIKENMDVAVLGLSGGVDSLVCACLLKTTLGEENVYAVHMPYGSVDLSKGKFNDNSLKIADKLEINSLYRPIAETVDSLNKAISYDTLKQTSTHITDLNKGNSRSRIRQCILYGIAHHLETELNKRTRVIGTGNLSEDYIGYDTKGGDALADLFLMGELLKSEVYQLAEYFADNGLINRDMIDYNPSAGLWDGQTDEDELGYSYADMEPSILKTRNPETGLSFQGYEIPVSGLNRTPLSKIDKFVLKRHLANRHKHLAPPTIPLRNFCEDIRSN